LFPLSPIIADIVLTWDKRNKN